MKRMFGRAQIRVSMMGVSAAALLIAAAPLQAQTQVKSFRIPAQPLGSALLEFSRQADVLIVVPPELTRGKRSRPVQAAIPAKQAIFELLEGSNLRAVTNPRGGYRIERLSAQTSVPQPQPVTQDAGAPERPAADASTAEGDPLIVVTGSRIARPNMVGASPVTSVDQAELALSGTTRVEDVLNGFPQFVPDRGGSAGSINGTGTATVNLRGLGASRTLVLMNGRRLPPGTPSLPVADINAVPGALIKRVDVLTGGASTIYGADAVAGVVNFIMDTSFTGIRLDAQYGLFHHDNGDDPRVVGALTKAGFNVPGGSPDGGGAFDATLTVGAGFADDRGHVTAYAGYRKIEGVMQGKYDYASCLINGVAGSDAFSCTPSSSTVPARIIAFTPQGQFLGDLSVDPTGTAFVPSGPGNTYNPNPFINLQRPDERFTAGAFLNYEMSESFRPYMEFSFMDDRTTGQNSPAGAGGAPQVVISCSNPFLSTAQRATLCGGDPTLSRFLIVGRRNVEGGNRTLDIRHEQYRAVLGTKGQLAPNWSYDLYGQYGRTNFESFYLNDVSTTRLSRALDVVVNPANGQPICRSALNGTDPSCVPYNPFTLPGLQSSASLGVTQAAIDYFRLAAQQEGSTTEYILSGAVTGELGGVSPWATDGLGLAFGAEYRKSRLERDADVSFNTGDILTFGSGRVPDLTGSFNVKELFGEARLPLIQDAAFTEELTVEGGYRYSAYTTNGPTGSETYDTHTYKLGLIWAPIEAVRFRGSYNRAVRAPSLVELFDPQVQSIANGVLDPCAGATPLFTLQQCQRTGVTAARYGTIPQNNGRFFNTVIGGNPSLEPEEADTYTAGVVLQPRNILPGFTATIDYFDITLNSGIRAISPLISVEQCAITGSPLFCSAVTRDPNTGTLYTGTASIRSVLLNIDSPVNTKGVDVALDYRTKFGGGSGIALSLAGSYLADFQYSQSFSSTSAAGTFDSYDCDGYFGQICGVPMPKWRHRARATFTAPSVWSASVNWRFVGPVKHDRTSTNAFLAGPTFPAFDRIAAQSYFDLALSAQVDENATFRIGVNNIFDKSPPVIGSEGLAQGVQAQANTYPQLYDPLGRYMFVATSIKF
jgi:outer membrane receptor protein involved in Fe transport